MLYLLSYTGVVGILGLEPRNPEGADLQSAAFSLFATLPYVIKIWRETESNRRHMELQSIALPTELPSLIAGAGFEPTTFGL